MDKQENVFEEYLKISYGIFFIVDLITFSPKLPQTFDLISLFNVPFKKDNDLHFRTLTFTNY